MLVKFKELTNARGYPLTGEILERNPDGTSDVRAFGLLGPGSDSVIRAVPADAIEECSWIQSETSP